MRRKQVIALLEIALLAAVLLGGGFFVLRWIDRASNAGERDAVAACQDGVLAQLRSPGSAVFPEPPYEGGLEVQHLEATDAYLWTAHVDAQNSFGALLRSEFVCTVSANGVADVVLLEP